MDKTIRIGVSSCLLGNFVRYDGGHQYDPFVSETLGRFVEFVPVCPEAGCGLGEPRETMRLVGEPERPRLMTTGTGIDHTDTLLSWARRKVRELKELRIEAFIFKSKSPSCGRERVKVHPQGGGVAKRVGVGLFAGVFLESFPLLPVEDEVSLHDPALRENFIERIFACHRWRAIKDTLTAGALVAFHSRHRLQVMAHSARHCRAMGRVVAQSGGSPIDHLCDEYETLLLEALRLQATVKKNCTVLFHILGCFKKTLTPSEKQELLEVIERYRLEHLPLIVPITLLHHYARTYPQEDLSGQYYLDPDPLELRLRNHA